MLARSAGKDWNEVLLRGGRDALAAWLAPRVLLDEDARRRVAAIPDDGAEDVWGDC